MARGHRIANRYNLSFGPGVDQAQFGADQGAVGLPDQNGDMAGAASRNLAAAMRVREQRIAGDMDIHGTPNRAIGGPAPDQNWDAFFGSLQQKDDQAANHGMHFRADLAGRGPGTGIGHLGVEGPDGHVEHPLDSLSTQNPSLAGLRTAANRINFLSRR